jgi:hypothetical protein
VTRATDGLAYPGAMPSAELRVNSRVVLQAHLDHDDVQLCACELIGVLDGTLALRPLDDLDPDLIGRPVTLLTSGQNCLLRLAGLVTGQGADRVEVEVDDEIEEVQRRRFARLTGWLPVRITAGGHTVTATLVDASLGGAAVVTDGQVPAGAIATLHVEAGDARAVVVGVTAVEDGVRRLHLRFEDDRTTNEVVVGLMAQLES